MRITNITINTKIRTYLQSLWNQTRKLHYLQLVIRKVKSKGAVFAFKCMTSCVPDYLTSNLVNRGQVSGGVTRNSQQLNIPFFKTAAGRRSFEDL